MSQEKLPPELENWKLREEMKTLREHVDRSISSIERGMETFQRTSTSEREEKHKQMLDLVKGMREEVDKTLSSFASRAKDIDTGISTIKTEVAVLQSERTDFKAVYTFVRNTVIGTILGAVMLFFLKPH